MLLTVVGKKYKKIIADESNEGLQCNIVRKEQYEADLTFDTA